MGRNRPADDRQLDLFSIPIPRTRAGSLRCDNQVAHILSEVLKDSDVSRYEVAARMSELTGKDITKFMLDSWTAEAREGHRFPLEFAAAFEQATNSYALTEMLADLRGCRVLVGKEALDAYLGQLVRKRQELDSKIRNLKTAIGKDGDE